MTKRANMPEHAVGSFDAERVIDIVRKAGNLVLEYRADFLKKDQQVPFSLKEDHSAVTKADIESNRFLVERLSKIYPGIKVISEEQDETINQDIINKHSTYWMIDPLDNTTRYIHGKPEFSINIALVEDGKPVYGVLYFPAMDLLYFTDTNGKSFKIDKGSEPIALQAPCAIAPHLPVTIAARKEDSVSDAITPMLVQKKHPFYKIIDSHGQHRPCLVAEGVATYCTQKRGYMPWDVAATVAVIQGAGGQIKDETGADLNFTSLSPLPPHIVASAEIMKTLLSHQHKTMKK